MEDAHLTATQLDEEISLFGVFDGHGGRGVSRFAANRLPSLLKETEEYKRGDYAPALEKAFLRVDEKLREVEGRKEIEVLDKPDAGSPAQPMAVPRRVLQRFLGAGGPAGEEEDEGGGAEGAEGAVDEVGNSNGHKDTQLAELLAADAADDADGEDEDDPLDEDYVQLADEALADGEDDDDDDDDPEADVILDEEEDMALVDPSRLTRDPTPEAQGCTAVVVLVVRKAEGEGPRLFCANAGDSRAVMSRIGKVVALSEDHKPENPGETARITKAGGFVQHMPGGARVQGDLNLSRAMGDLRYKKPEHLPPEEQILTAFPEVRTFPLTEDDEFMVLGCDGIWERASNEDMVNFVRQRIVAKDDNGKAVALSQICGEVCDRGLCPSMDAAENDGFDGTGCDNMTVVIVQLKKDICIEGRRPETEPVDHVNGTAKRHVDEPQSEEVGTAKKQKIASEGEQDASPDAQEDTGENLPQ